MLPINTAAHLKAWQSFYKFKELKKKDKGRFGEELSCKLLCEKFKLKLKHKNLRTPYGEIDLVLEGEGFVLFVEVKVDFVGRVGDEVWSKNQRVRFRRSQGWYAKKEFCEVRGGVVLVTDERFQYLVL